MDRQHHSLLNSLFSILSSQLSPFSSQLFLLSSLLSTLPALLSPLSALLSPLNSLFFPHSSLLLPLLLIIIVGHGKAQAAKAEGLDGLGGFFHSLGEQLTLGGGERA